MPDPHRIEALPRVGGQTVVVRGWVTTTRSSGKIAFVVLRDGTGYLQVVLSKKDVPDAAWEAFAQLTQETSVEVMGTVRADPRAPGGVELTAADLKIIGPSHDFPITPKEHGTAFLFEHRHLWLRSRRQVAIARVRHEVIQAIRDFFYERHFVVVDTPILTGSIGEAAGHLFAVEYFDLGTAYLAQTGQLYVEAAAAAVPAHCVHRCRGEAHGPGARHGVGAGPGRRRGDPARPAVRPARDGVQLSPGGQGLLHEGKPRRPAYRAQQRHAGPRGVRRDHRRQPARGRLRPAARPHPRGEAPRRGLRLVSRPAEVRHLRPLGGQH